MATQNYASATLDIIDERFALASKTDIVVNKGIRLDFNGRNSVTIYNVNVVAETDYVRAGANRFGNLVELGDGVETFTLSQDKAFTFTVDQGNLEDSMMVTEANKAVKRQIREVSIPTTDKYVLTTLQAYAVANSQSATAALTASNAYTKLLAANAVLDDALVPPDDRVVFLSASTYNLLKLDQNFSKQCDTAYADLKKGILGMIDGITLVKVPVSYLPANTGYLLVYNQIAVSPHKFDMIRILTDVQGVHGAVAEGRRYYDCFIPTQRATGIFAHMVA
jgi:N4-gp56 family major capsid protein